MNKPECAVRGMPVQGAVCGKVLVGMKYCGYSGECQHKVPQGDSSAAVQQEQSAK